MDIAVSRARIEVLNVLSAKIEEIKLGTDAKDREDEVHGNIGTQYLLIVRFLRVDIADS